MIYTLTVNPAIDYVISLDSFDEGGINRTTAEHIFAGGKGINVSTVLKNLGRESTALGFVAGATGKMLEDMLCDQRIKTDFVHVSEGRTRINVKMHAVAETEINGQGPIIDGSAVVELYRKLEKLVAGDYLVMSGSMPGCLQSDNYQAIVNELKLAGFIVSGTSFYSDICELMGTKEVNVIVDSTKELLIDTIKYHPLLVKPNNHELGELFGADIKSYDDAIKFARKLCEMGALNVMVSMASMGAVLVDEHGNSYICHAPLGNVINSVGAGDTTVAAFLARYIEQATGAIDSVDYSKIVRYAVAAGSATAFKPGLATREDIELLL